MANSIEALFEPKKVTKIVVAKMPFSEVLKVALETKVKATKLESGVEVNYGNCTKSYESNEVAFTQILMSFKEKSLKDSHCPSWRMNKSYGI